MADLLVGVGICLAIDVVVFVAYWALWDYCETERGSARISGESIGWDRGHDSAEEHYIAEAVERGFGRYHPTTGEFEWFSKGDLLRELRNELQSASNLPDSQPAIKTGE